MPEETDADYDIVPTEAKEAALARNLAPTDAGVTHHTSDDKAKMRHVNYPQYLAAHAATNNKAASTMPYPPPHQAASLMPHPPLHPPDNDDMAMPDVTAINDDDAMKLQEDANTPTDA
mmetsp:Transcript_17983/g.22363  ORF Transcript_17983/g.22363 Transcript_17983/m.22363 type:complete len:118 (-) Transcript_17983:1535-1888(-)